MVISSRTPEGEPNRCSLCGHQVRIDATHPPGDAPCPDCGQLLWFGPHVARKTSVVTSREEKTRLAVARLLKEGSKRFGVPKADTTGVLRALQSPQAVQELQKSLAQARSWDEVFSLAWDRATREELSA